MAEPGDLAALDEGLAALSAEIGDPHLATADDLRAGLFGPAAFVNALVAGPADGLAGLVLFTPVFSTVRGGAGVYVSDIWVAPVARGGGLGARLLGAVTRTAKARWDARFLRLAVHDDNASARRFYAGLGFAPVAGETPMALTGPAFDDLGRAT